MKSCAYRWLATLAPLGMVGLACGGTGAAGAGGPDGSFDATGAGGNGGSFGDASAQGGSGGAGGSGGSAGMGGAGGSVAAMEAGGAGGSGGTAGAEDSGGNGTADASDGSRSHADSGLAATEPCDLYKAGGTPCVAAFSTVRALFGAYAGDLYQVTRADNTTQEIGVLSAGGVANAAAQDTFCAGTTCTISILYDQSGQGNHLTRAPKGSNNHGAQDVLAVANALPITIGGHKAYGIHSPPGTGYRNDATKGVATGDNPEVIYEVTGGTYTVDGCCFDFGNAETNNMAGANGSMEALFFGTGFWDKGSGAGPWIMADLEDGVYDQSGVSGATNTNDPSMPYAFVTGMIKGNSSNATTGNGPFAIKGSNAQSGTLSTFYNGARPTGYSPMRKQGAILLGVGGDDSNMGGGNFYEGVMTSGYSSDATDDAVQANIVAAGYGM
jgi:non-reducing end alpha-L-arabinofuranosidase